MMHRIYRDHEGSSWECPPIPGFNVPNSSPYRTVTPPPPYDDDKAATTPLNIDTEGSSSQQDGSRPKVETELDKFEEASPTPAEPANESDPANDTVVAIQSPPSAPSDPTPDQAVTVSFD